MSDFIVRKDGTDPYPEVLLRGETFQAIMQSMNFLDFQPIVDEWLAESGIGQIDPAAWYPRQEWLNLLKKLEDKPGAMQNQVSIGLKVIDNVVLPEGMTINTVNEAISMLIAVYVNNQQNLPEGDTGYTIKEIDDKHFEILDTSPYLLHVNYGYIYGILKRFLPTGFTLEYEHLNEEEPLMGPIKFRVELD